MFGSIKRAVRRFTVASSRFVKATLHRIVEHIKKNPEVCAFQLPMPLVAILPGVLLLAMGFSNVGPLAGSAAAAYQSAHGATTGFSFLQSAAMGGTAAFGVAVTGVAAAAVLVAQRSKRA
ncbi:hypothetical protein LTR53_018175 [Teratosphaeriaceae sp. CCFEE 6253]|nr:hypothetical protein LTR53_018175 [Teratosphaeriaceae sp. CCFEE 6253]